MKNILPIIIVCSLIGSAKAQNSEAKQHWKESQQGVDYAHAEVEKAPEPYQSRIHKCKKTGDELGLEAAYGDLGSIYRAQGRFQDAIDAWKQALELATKGHHPDHLLAAMLLNNIGEAYRSAGQLDQSLAALSDAKSRLKEGEPSYDIVMQNLGMTFAKSNRNKEAEEAFRINADAPPSALLPHNQTIVESMYSLSLLYEKDKRTDDLLALLEKAIPLSAKSFGESDTRTEKFRLEREKIRNANVVNSEWKDYMEQAKTAMNSQRFAEAVTLFEKSLKIAQAKAPDSLSEALTKASLASAHLHTGQYLTCERELTEALPVYEKSFGANSEQVLGLRQGLEIVRAQLGKGTGGLQLQPQPSIKLPH